MGMGALPETLISDIAGLGKGSTSRKGTRLAENASPEEIVHQIVSEM